EKIGTRCIAGQVAADFAAFTVGTYDHRYRIPTDNRSKPLLDFQIPGIKWFCCRLDGVAVRRIARQWNLDAPVAGAFQNFAQQCLATRATLRAEYVVERLQPFLRF